MKLFLLFFTKLYDFILGRSYVEIETPQFTQGGFYMHRQIGFLYIRGFFKFEFIPQTLGNGNHRVFFNSIDSVWGSVSKWL